MMASWTEQVEIIVFCYHGNLKCFKCPRFIVGLVLFFILAPLPFVPYLLVPAAVLIGRLDVYQFVLEDIVPASIRSNRAANILLIALRLGLLFVPTVESTRIFPFLIFIMGIPGIAVTEMVESLGKLKLG